MSEQPNEIDLMRHVDSHPKTHLESTPEEQAALRAEYGHADEHGVFGRPADAEEDADG